MAGARARIVGEGRGERKRWGGGRERGEEMRKRRRVEEITARRIVLWHRQILH
jgi:hypothetical protein